MFHLRQFILGAHPGHRARKLIVAKSLQDIRAVRLRPADEVCVSCVPTVVVVMEGGMQEKAKMLSRLKFANRA